MSTSTRQSKHSRTVRKGPYGRCPPASALRSLALALAGITASVLQGGCGPELGVAPVTCSTQAVSAGESPLMEPGGDCMTCHASYGAPTFTFAGTVMNGLHDDQNCQGVGGVSIRITDAANKVVEMTTNANGNFYSSIARSAITFPYKAEVTRNGKTLAMVGTRGPGETDCASCHTATGLNTAAGRILAP